MWFANPAKIWFPAFKKVTLNLENGKQFVIAAPQNNEKNLYIQSALLRGAGYDKNYLYHADIIKGGRLEFKMGEYPNVKRGIDPAAMPFSIYNYISGK